MVREVPDYLEICHSQIESNDYRDIAEFQAFFEQLINLGFMQLKEANIEKKSIVDKTKEEMKSLCQLSILEALEKLPLNERMHFI